MKPQRNNVGGKTLFEKEKAPFSDTDRYAPDVQVLFQGGDVSFSTHATVQSF
jgi:hypothetical protein